MRGVLFVLLCQSCEALLMTTGSSRHRPQPRMSAGDSPVQLTANSGEGGQRVAVSGLQPQQSQEYVGVPPPGSNVPAPPSLLSRAKGPFVGITLVATAGVAAWQSNRLYRMRQDRLLQDFGATLVYHLGDEREMASAIKSFRQQLGPGSYKSAMFTSFLIAFATDVPIGVSAIKGLATVTSMMKLTDAAAATALEGAAAELQKQPSVLGKLTFVAERAMPAAAGMAKLRSRFPNWSLDTVTALQRAMLENLYRDMCADKPVGSPHDGETLRVLNLSEPDATRLLEEVAEKKAAAIAAEKAAAEEEARARQLQQALENAARSDSDTAQSSKLGGDDDDDESAPSDDRASGTHEYECTYEGCGYTMFPAAGREGKFFGPGFTCPQCGQGKDYFVDNGAV